MFICWRFETWRCSYDVLIMEEPCQYISFSSIWQLLGLYIWTQNALLLQLLSSPILILVGNWNSAKELFSIKMASSQYRETHCRAKIILRLTVLSPQWDFLCLTVFWTIPPMMIKPSMWPPSYLNDSLAQCNAVIAWSFFLRNRHPIECVFYKLKDLCCTFNNNRKPLYIFPGDQCMSHPKYPYVAYFHQSLGAFFIYTNI